MKIDPEEDSITIRYYIDLSKELDEFTTLQLNLIEKHGGEPREDAIDRYQVSIMSPTGALLLQGAEDNDEEDFDDEKHDYTCSIATLFSVTENDEWLTYEIGGEVFHDALHDIEDGKKLAARIKKRNEKLLKIGWWMEDPVTGMLVSRIEPIFTGIADLLEELDMGIADDSDVKRWIKNNVDYALVREDWHPINEKPKMLDFVIQLYDGPCFSGSMRRGNVCINRRRESLSVFREPLGTSNNEWWFMSEKVSNDLKLFLKRLNKCNVWKNVNTVPHLLINGANLARDWK